MATNYDRAHGDIEPFTSDIYMVRGKNVTEYAGQVIQHSRNMLIIRDNGTLTLINTVRLDEAGLAALEALGDIKHVIRIGAFHGRDDAFYLERYQAKFWALQDSKIAAPHQIDVILQDGQTISVEDGQFYHFQHAKPSEGFLYLNRLGGIIITCDSIKNWQEIDIFFSTETGQQALACGEIATARISPIWLQATGVTKADFEKLLSLPFETLISAHGDVLIQNAKQAVEQSVENITVKRE